MARPRETEPAPEFFIDRSLGRSIAEGLREAGLVVHTMAEVYEEEAAQALADEVWLADAGENHWIVLTKDDGIRRRPAERDAFIAAKLRVFCLTNRNLRGSEQTRRFCREPASDPAAGAKTWSLHIRRVRARSEEALAAA